MVYIKKIFKIIELKDKNNPFLFLFQLFIGPLINNYAIKKPLIKMYLNETAYSFKQYKKALSDKDVVIYSVPLTNQKMYKQEFQHLKKVRFLINATELISFDNINLIKIYENNFYIIIVII